MKVKILKNEVTEELHPTVREYLELFESYCRRRGVVYDTMPNKAVNALLFAAVTERYPNEPGRPSTCHNSAAYNQAYLHLINSRDTQRNSSIVRRGTLLPPEIANKQKNK